MPAPKVLSFQQKRNIEISPVGDTVESGFIIMNSETPAIYKALNDLGVAQNPTEGKGIVISQDPTTAQCTYTVKDYDDIAKLSDMAESGFGPKSTLLDQVSLNDNGIKNGSYFASKCSNAPAENKFYFLQTQSYEKYIWQSALDPTNGERWYRYKNDTTWSAWTLQNANIPVGDRNGNIWIST